MLISGFPPSFEDINLEINWSPFPMDDGSVICGVERSRAPKSTSSELSSFALKIQIRRHTVSVGTNKSVINVKAPGMRLVKNTHQFSSYNVSLNLRYSDGVIPSTDRSLE